MDAFKRALGICGKKHMGYLFLYFGAAVLISACSVWIERLTGLVGDAAVSGDTDGITRFLLWMAAVMGGKIAISAAATLWASRYTGRNSHLLRDRFARFLLHAPYGTLMRQKSGDTLTLYTRDLELASELVSKSAFGLAMDFSTLLASAAYMLYVSPWLSLGYLALFPLFAWFQMRISKPIEGYVVEAAKRSGDLNAVIQDSLQNVSAIAAYSLEPFTQMRFAQSYERYLEACMKRIRVFSRLIVSGIIATYIPVVLVLALSAIMTLKGRMGFAEFIAYNAVAGTVGSWLTMLSQQLGWLRERAASGGRICDCLEAAGGVKEETTALAGKAAPYAVPCAPASEPALSFEHISFGYEADRPVLTDICFSIQAGQKVALVGPSGCGKSTIIRLLLGLYSAQNGSIRMLSRELSDMPTDERHPCIAYVPQDSFLLPLSIRENIIGADEWNPSDQAQTQRLQSACENAGILSFIQSLPGQFDTLLTEAAVNLSGGQRQRIAIARALYKDAPILLMDEATSALDPLMEAEVLRRLASLSQEKTALIVAHRLAAVRFCDMILVLDGGRLVQQGTYDELISADGAFRALYAGQQEEEAQ